MKRICLIPGSKAAHQCSSKYRVVKFYLLLILSLGMIQNSFAQLNQWIWKNGPNAVHQPAVYGTLGVPNASNIPSARNNSVYWKDAAGNLWLFGGTNQNSSFPLYDDLWKWDGTNWTWMGGPNTANQFGNYGTLGISSGTNWPGSRSGAVSWKDASGNVWVFGGYGYPDYNAYTGKMRLNDLWKWDGTNWTWMKGSKTDNQLGTYGTLGVAAASNNPGGRNYGVSWKDAAGNAWVFGGIGFASSYPVTGFLLRMLNDLWKWDGTNWTWVSGSNTFDQTGVYGVKGVASATNVPGARYGSTSWTDAAGNAWLFGGAVNSSTVSFNDLWKWDGTNWTWVSGSNLTNQNGVYGTQGVAAPTNMPGARYNAVVWTDATGNIWLMGGNGRDAAGSLGFLNDLWKWDGINWTWIGGSNSINQSGNYGTMNVSAASNIPGGRERPAVWKDNFGNFWMFGGNGYAVNYPPGYLNDMWQYTTSLASLPLHLLTFNGSALATGKNQLRWETANEINTKEFVIERSSDNTFFIDAGIVTANGSSSGTYTWIDNTFLPGAITYYKLKMKDKDGSFTYSSTVKIIQSLPNDIYLFPNCIDDKATLHVPEKLMGTTASIFDAGGRLVKVIRISSTYQPVDASLLPAGKYFLFLSKDNICSFIKK